MPTKTPAKPQASAVDTSDQERQARLRRLGSLIREARGEMSQMELGVLLGGLPQTTISRWERGTVELSVEQVRDIERALKMQRGALLTASGYVQAGIANDAAEQMLASDPRIHPELRDDLLASYRSFVRLSERFFATEARSKGPGSRRSRTKVQH